MGLYSKKQIYNIIEYMKDVIYHYLRGSYMQSETSYPIRRGGFS